MLVVVVVVMKLVLVLVLDLVLVLLVVLMLVLVVVVLLLLLMLLLLLQLFRYTLFFHRRSSLTSEVASLVRSEYVARTEKELPVRPLQPPPLVSKEERTAHGFRCSGFPSATLWSCTAHRDLSRSLRHAAVSRCGESTGPWNPKLGVEYWRLSVRPVRRNIRVLEIGPGPTCLVRWSDYTRRGNLP